MDDAANERVKKAGEAILELLQVHPGGCKNPEALAQITRLAQGAVSASEYDSYVSEKASSIKSFAAILYSERKHRKYDEKFPNGAEKVRSFIASAARALMHLPTLPKPMREGE